MKELNYKVFLHKEPEGEYTVTVPSLSGCITYGDNVDEALVMAKEAIELYLETLRDDGEEIPAEENVLETSVAALAHA